MSQNLQDWLHSGEYLPEIMRDFHDQKDLFKVMHTLYADSDSIKEIPGWVAGHIYTIDCFLWFMASRGYTLQKSRKNVEFKSLAKYRDIEKQLEQSNES